MLPHDDSGAFAGERAGVQHIYIDQVVITGDPAAGLAALGLAGV